MLDDFGRAAVDLQPGQRFAKDAAVGQRALARGLARESRRRRCRPSNLPQPLDVAARERQLAEAGPPGRRRPSIAAASEPCLPAVDGRPRCCRAASRLRRPSGTSRLPSRIAFVSVSGVDSNRRR